MSCSRRQSFFSPYVRSDRDAANNYTPELPTVDVSARGHVDVTLHEGKSKVYRLSSPLDSPIKSLLRIRVNLVLMYMSSCLLHVIFRPIYAPVGQAIRHSPIFGVAGTIYWSGKAIWAELQAEKASKLPFGVTCHPRPPLIGATLSRTPKTATESAILAQVDFCVV